jgi:hypothetical protein
MGASITKESLTAPAAIAREPPRCRCLALMPMEQAVAINGWPLETASTTADPSARRRRPGRERA